MYVCIMYVPSFIGDHVLICCFRFCCYDDGAVPAWNDPGAPLVSATNEMVIHFDGTFPQATNAYTYVPVTSEMEGFELCYRLGKYHKRKRLVYKYYRMLTESFESPY